MSFAFQEFPPEQEQTKAVIPIEEKANPSLIGYVTFSDTPTPISPPRNYRAYVKEAYQTDDTTYKVVKYIAGNGAAIPPKLYTDRTCQQEIESHPLLDKLESPNKEQTGVAYREAVLSYLLIAGNAYQYAIRKGIKGPPDELWALEPDKVAAVIRTSEGIVGWNFDDFEKEKNPIDAANIGHVKFWSPTSPIYGQSPLEAIALSIDQQTAARKWNLSLLQNYAKSGGTWIAPTVLSPNDYSKTLEKLREIFAGFANAGKTQLLDGAMQWVNQGMSPTDLDWLPGMQYNAGSIANGYDIAPQLIGNTASTTYDNMDQAKAASYTESIFPVNDKVYALWNKWFLPMYADLCDSKGRPTAYLYYDKESIEVLQAIIQAKNSAKIDQATKQFLAGGIDMFTYQEMCSTKPDPNGKGIYRVGPILVTSEKLQDYAEQAMKTPAAVPKPVPEPVDENALPDATQQQQQGNEPPPKKSRKAKDDDEEEHTGIMIALFLDKASAKKLAIKDGEPPEELHVTLAYLGDKNEIDLDVDDLSETLADYASEAIPLEGSISGVARFAASESSDNMSPVVALVNISGLQKWRDALVKQVELAGYEVAQNFEYTPHCTLAYIDEDASMPVESVPDLALSFDKLWLAVGDDRYSFPIGDEQYPAKKRRLRLYNTKATSINAFNLDTGAKKKAYIKAMESVREQWVEHGQEQLQTYFKAEHKAVSAVLDGTDTKKSALKAAIEGQSAKLKKTISRLWQDVEEDIGSQVAQSFKDGKKANIPTPAMVTDTEVRYLLQMAGEKVTGIDETTLEDLQNALAEGVANGESVAEIAACIDALYLDDIIPNRSMVIAQSEICAASNRAGWLAAQSSDMALNKTWMTTSGHPRPAHEDADGQEVALGDPFDVGGEELDHPGDPSGSEGNVINCFPGDTLVTAFDIKAATRRWYEGDLVEIRTESGFSLSGTPNHPILTDRGWIALSELKEGDSVVSRSLSEESALSDMDVHHRPTCMSEIFDSLLNVGIAHRVSRVHVDFHGERSDSDVDVVLPTSMLGNYIIDSTLTQPLHEQYLAPTDLVKMPLSTESISNKSFFREGFASQSSMSGLSKSAALIGASSSHAQLQTLGRVTGSDTSFMQEAINDQPSASVLDSKGVDGHARLVLSNNSIHEAIVLAHSASTGPGSSTALLNPLIDTSRTHSQDIGNFLKNFAGLVQLTRITHVFRRAFSGHVYNLQTETNLYSANSIISHNCHCMMIFTSAASGQEADISEEDYVSEEESKQSDVNWAISMEAARERKRRKLASKEEYQRFMNASLK